MKAVSAKITDLEKEKGKTDTGNGEGRREGEKTDEGTAQVRIPNVGVDDPII